MPAIKKSKATSGTWQALGDLKSLKEKGQLTGHGIVAFQGEKSIHAVDNRCPHMGFPLSKGTVQGGILTCHWHSWQFDLCSGGCLTPTESDVAVYPVRVRDGVVEVNLKGGDKTKRLEKARARMRVSLGTASRLELTKALYRLLKEGESLRDLLDPAVDLGLRLQTRFSGGMVSLTALARLLDEGKLALDAEDQVLALVQGMAIVAGEVQGQAPRRFHAALPNESVPLERLQQWFRNFLEDRETFAAERVLRSAVASGASQAQIAETLLSAATDHVFIGEGHVLDFCNKAFELLDLVGWDKAGDLLTSLLHELAEATRHEEELSWKHPENLITRISEAEKQIKGLSFNSKRDDKGDCWKDGEFLCAAEPEQGFKFLIETLSKRGLVAAAEAIAAGAVLRMHRFHVRNEFFDWDTVHHLLTHANAFLRLARRFPSATLARNAFHAYGYLYLTRFLNLPAAALPETAKPDFGKNPLEGLSSAIESRHIDEAAARVHCAIALGQDRAALKALTLATISEDHGFHSWQQLEASLSLFELLPQGPHRARPLSSFARWLAAHSPTPRSMKQTVKNAISLERGDRLYED